MQKAHNNIDWENGPSDKTPINERNLNKMDKSIDLIDDRVIAHDTTKFNVSDAQTLIKGFAFDYSTGVITITYYNGSTATVNTGLAKVSVNFRFDENTQILYVIAADGTEQPVDLSSFITDYEFLDSDTIAHSVDTSGKVSSAVKEGSIEEKHLRPDYLADIRVEVAKTEANKNAAAESEANAEKSAENAKKSEMNAATSETKSEQYKTDAEMAADNAKASETASKLSETNAKASETAAKDSENAAELSRDLAAKSEEESAKMANLSKSWAVGTSDTVRDGDSIDNSQYYSNQSQNSAALSREYYEKTERAGNDIINTINNSLDNISKGLPAFGINFDDGCLYYSGTRFAFMVNTATGNLDWGLTV